MAACSPGQTAPLWLISPRYSLPRQFGLRFCPAFEPLTATADENPGSYRHLADFLPVLTGHGYPEAVHLVVFGKLSGDCCCLRDGALGVGTFLSGFVCVDIVTVGGADMTDTSARMELS